MASNRMELFVVRAHWFYHGRQTVAIQLVYCSEYEQQYRHDKSDSSSAIKLSNCILSMPSMPPLRNSSTQSSCSISVIHTAASIDTALFINTPRGKLPHGLAAQTDDLLEGRWLAISSMSVGTWSWCMKMPDDRDCLPIVNSHPAMLYSSLIVTFGMVPT